MFSLHKTVISIKKQKHVTCVHGHGLFPLLYALCITQGILGLEARTLVFRVSDIGRLKAVSSATETV